MHRFWPLCGQQGVRNSSNYSDETGNKARPIIAVNHVCDIKCVAPYWEAAFIHILENLGGCFTCHLGTAPCTLGVEI
jgi:hypothetical protein